MVTRDGRKKFQGLYLSQSRKSVTSWEFRPSGKTTRRQAPQCLRSFSCCKYLTPCPYHYNELISAPKAENSPSFILAIRLLFSTLNESVMRHAVALCLPGSRFIPPHRPHCVSTISPTLSSFSCSCLYGGWQVNQAGKTKNRPDTGTAAREWWWDRDSGVP